MKSPIATPYRVKIVLDPNFGERLAALPVNEPVWIIDSTANTPIALQAWKMRPNRNDHLTGITTFKPVAAFDPEEELLAQLAPIDLHHGNYSADPAYSLLEVIGCAASDRIRAALAEFGFEVQESSANGFTATHAST